MAHKRPKHQRINSDHKIFNDLIIQKRKVKETDLLGLVRLVEGYNFTWIRLFYSQHVGLEKQRRINTDIIAQKKV